MKLPEAKNKVSFQVAPPHLLLNKKFDFVILLSHLCLCHLVAEINCLRQHSFLILLMLPSYFILKAKGSHFSLIVRTQFKEGN